MLKQLITYIHIKKVFIYIIIIEKVLIENNDLSLYDAGNQREVLILLIKFFIFCYDGVKIVSFQ